MSIHTVQSTTVLCCWSVFIPLHVGTILLCVGFVARVVFDGDQFVQRAFFVNGVCPKVCGGVFEAVILSLLVRGSRVGSGAKANDALS